jgi:hypothetical protein
MHQERYKDKLITVDVLKRRKSWTWTYQINGGPVRRCGDRPLPAEDSALKEAIREAKSEIDRMSKEKNPKIP